MSIDVGAAGGSLIGVLVLVLVLSVVTGLVPGAMIRQLVRIFPKGHPRREELKAELYHVPFLERIPWLCQSIEIVFSEGLPARWRDLRSRQKHRRSSADPERLAVGDLVDVRIEGSAESFTYKLLGAPDPTRPGECVEFGNGDGKVLYGHLIDRKTRTDTTFPQSGN